MNKPLLTVLGTLLILSIATIIVMFFAQGNRINNGNLEQTGILTVNSTPEGALIFLNDVRQDVTDHSIQGLKPGTYSLSLESTGFHPWSKEVNVEIGQVTQHSATLVSLFPEIKPLTLTGVDNPILSNDGSTIVYTTNNAEENLPSQAGVWLLELSSSPFNITTSRPRLIISDTPEITYSDGTLSWGGEDQYLVLEMPDNTMYLYDLQAGELRTLTPENKAILEEDWAELKTTNEELLREQFSEDIRAALPSEDTNAIWSPDQTKILYTEVNDSVRVYNIIDLNPTEFSIPVQTPEDINRYTVFQESSEQNAIVYWHPDSMHIYVLEKSNENAGTISIIDIDGTNKTAIYTGRIVNGNVFPHPDGSQILLHTNFTSDEAQSNLYSVVFN